MMNFRLAGVVGGSVNGVPKSCIVERHGYGTEKRVKGGGTSPKGGREGVKEGKDSKEGMLTACR